MKHTFIQTSNFQSVRIYRIDGYASIWMNVGVVHPIMWMSFPLAMIPGHSIVQKHLFCENNYVKGKTTYHSPTLGAHTHAHAHPCPWVLGGHGCDIVGNIIGNVTIFEYMGVIWIAWVGIGRCWWVWSRYGYKFEGNVGLYNLPRNTKMFVCLILVFRPLEFWSEPILRDCGWRCIYMYMYIWMNVCQDAKMPRALRCSKNTSSCESMPKKESQPNRERWCVFLECHVWTSQNSENE